MRSLDHAEFFDCFAHVLEAKRNFYTQALADTNPYSLRNYLYHLYLPALRNDIDLILANRYLPQENIQFLAEFYTCAFLYYFIRKCDQPGADRLTGQARPSPTSSTAPSRRRSRKPSFAATCNSFAPCHPERR